MSPPWLTTTGSTNCGLPSRTHDMWTARSLSFANSLHHLSSGSCCRRQTGRDAFRTNPVFGHRICSTPMRSAGSCATTQSHMRSSTSFATFAGGTQHRSLLWKHTFPRGQAPGGSTPSFHDDEFSQQLCPSRCALYSNSILSVCTLVRCLTVAFRRVRAPQLH